MHDHRLAELSRRLLGLKQPDQVVGLRPDQVAFGVPANINAGNGFTPVAEVQKALNYLVLGQSFGGGVIGTSGSAASV